MKAITIKQPWASFIVHGLKDIENRTWACPKKYIGQRVLIHAGADKTLMNTPSSDFMTEYQMDAYEKNRFDFPVLERNLYSVIIGSVEIVDCVINHPSIWAEQGVWNWVLANPILYEEAIENVKGKLSFWDYPGINEVKIECHECGSIEIAIEDYTTAPFPTYLHRCNKCEHVIMESEWNVIK